jgi:hypothetical protein
MCQPVIRGRLQGDDGPLVNVIVYTLNFLLYYHFLAMSFSRILSFFVLLIRQPPVLI